MQSPSYRRCGSVVDICGLARGDRCPLQMFEGVARRDGTKADGNHQRRWLGSNRPSHRFFKMPSPVGVVICFSFFFLTGGEYLSYKLNK